MVSPAPQKKAEEETPEAQEQTPAKKDERREDYDRAKLVTSLQKACQKRPVSADELERLVDRLEKRLQEQVEREVASQRIGDWVMTELVRLDALAAARFASVFRNFENADDYAAFFESLARGDS